MGTSCYFLKPESHIFPAEVPDLQGTTGRPVLKVHGFGDCMSQAALDIGKAATIPQGTDAQKPPHRYEFEIHVDVFGLRDAYIPEAHPSQTDEDMKKTNIGLISAMMVLLFALPAISSVMAISGSIACIAPASCASSDTLSLSGPGSSATATVWFYGSSLASGTTIYYFACPTSASTCSVQSGTDGTTGWSWSFSTATGTTSSGSYTFGAETCGTSCEGNGAGAPSTLTLKVTAPTGSLATTYPSEDITIYACTSSGTSYVCSSSYEQVASLSITSTVPQFALGLGLAITIGLVGLVVAKKKTTAPNIASIVPA